jgi:SpoVK/Ycf46/Vps4 family AAA+-type ATPase
MLSGQALHAVGTVAQMARDLQPAVLVLEDVDLVAEDRSFDRHNPVLFALLDAMDGAAADADLLFLLTTNRADLLEPALAARPGRVDVAVEISLPDAEARRRLFALYTRGVPLALDESEVEVVVDRTEGVTASFVKELVRRSVLEALTAGRPAGEPLTGEVVSRALDDLLDSGQAVTRALLGVGADEGGGVLPQPGLAPRGHFAPLRHAYRSQIGYPDG